MPKFDLTLYFKVTDAGLKVADGLENATLNLTTATFKPASTALNFFIIKILRISAQSKLSPRILTHKLKLISTHSLSCIFVDNLAIVQLHFVLEGWIYRHNPIF